MFQAIQLAGGHMIYTKGGGLYFIVSFADLYTFEVVDINCHLTC